MASRRQQSPRRDNCLAGDRSIGRCNRITVGFSDRVQRMPAAGFGELRGGVAYRRAAAPAGTSRHRSRSKERSAIPYPYGGLARSGVRSGSPDVRSLLVRRLSTRSSRSRSHGSAERTACNAAVRSIVPPAAQKSARLPASTTRDPRPQNFAEIFTREKIARKWTRASREACGLGGRRQERF